jgi:hypothetical protein
MRASSTPGDWVMYTGNTSVFLKLMDSLDEISELGAARAPVT